MESAKFNFVPQNEKETFLSNKNILDKLMQWSMKGNLKLRNYNFNQQFYPYQKQDFVYAFFKDCNVYSTLETYHPSSSSWSAIGDIIEKVEYELVPTSQISMAFFDRISDARNNVVYQTGEIRQCMEEQIDDFYVSNNLSAMLLDENSEVFSLYSKAERKEFLFSLFLHLVLGGQWCQWDDTLKPYLDVTKSLYKELMSVEREEGTTNIRVRSVVLKVICYDKEGHTVFPAEPHNIQNFCYLIIDPFKRSVSVLTHYHAASLNV